MKRFVMHCTLLGIAMTMFSLSGSVQAQGLLDQGKNLLGGSSGGGAAGLVGALPLDKIMSLLRKQEESGHAPRRVRCNTHAAGRIRKQIGP